MVPLAFLGGATMKHLNIFLLGRFRTDHDCQELQVRKVQELLCFLLLHRDHPYSREFLADILWDGDGSAKARTYLRKTLWQLHSALSAVIKCETLEADNNWITLQKNESLWTDTTNFGSVFHEVESLAGATLSNSQLRATEEAINLYKGELLEGWYQDWCVCERERFEYIYLAMLDKLVDYYEAHCAYERGISYGLRILDHDRAHERTHRKLMKLHALAGDRTSALRQFENCRTILQAELSVEPSRPTIELYTLIRDDQKIPEVPTNTVPALPLQSSATLLLTQLEQVRHTLDSLHQQVETEIELLQTQIKSNH
jgi:DNA-binding SARP family transcriptional activator